jgi:hypothetical protein
MWTRFEAANNALSETWFESGSAATACRNWFSNVIRSCDPFAIVRMDFVRREKSRRNGRRKDNDYERNNSLLHN